MPNIPIATGSFTPAPEGVFQAVCCDVVDHGTVTQEYAGEIRSRHVIELKWQLDQLMDNGTPFLVSQRFTASLHEKSKLLPFIESWRGKKLTAEDLKTFDIEDYIGRNCMLQIVHNVGRNGQTYANVQSIQPYLERYGAEMEVSGYTRVIDRPAYGEQAKGQYAQAVGVAPERRDPEVTRADIREMKRKPIEHGSPDGPETWMDSEAAF
ncbi:MAG: hypothetical protein H0W99_13935 [Acidobacteria bacterium]|nr:hypothetical protein [Acidobacteriota bacterium]